MDKSSHTIIPQSAMIQGDFLAREDLEVDGLIEGKVYARNVLIREFGRVEGTIFADQIVVTGEVCGPIEARNIMLTSSASVKGDLYFANIIHIEPGARHEGKAVRTHYPLDSHRAHDSRLTCTIVS